MCVLMGAKGTIEAEYPNHSIFNQSFLAYIYSSPLIIVIYKSAQISFLDRKVSCYFEKLLLHRISKCTAWTHGQEYTKWRRNKRRCIQSIQLEHRERNITHGEETLLVPCYGIFYRVHCSAKPCFCFSFDLQSELSYVNIYKWCARLPTLHLYLFDL